MLESSFKPLTDIVYLFLRAIFDSMTRPPLTPEDASAIIAAFNRYMQLVV